MPRDFPLAPEAALLLRRLTEQGFEAYVVGGCVRDSLLGLSPQDWDITTSALPEEIIASLEGLKILDTGLQHGTVTAIVEGKPVEITTYRTDGTYSDHRHPDSVSFTRSLTEDLARRDFTVNAMAYHPEHGILDYFDGKTDLQRRTLRCVGQPVQRFQEDGLRIFRALRFASKLEFHLEESTAQAAVSTKKLLLQIAPERLQRELTGLLRGKACESVLREYAPIVMELLPELKPMDGFDQHNPYHAYDVWEHTLHAVGAVEPTPILRLAMLFHDSGKPASYTRDAKGIGHFHGHARFSGDIADQALRRLKFDNHTRDRVLQLIKYHDLPLHSTPEWIKRQLQQFGEEMFSQLLSVHRADILAQNPDLADRVQVIQHCRDIVEDVLQAQQCFSLKKLAVNGHDMVSIGIPSGPKIGTMLTFLLDAVISETCENNRKNLLALAKQHLSDPIENSKIENNEGGHYDVGL